MRRMSRIALGAALAAMLMGRNPGAIAVDPPAPTLPTVPMPSPQQDQAPPPIGSSASAATGGIGAGGSGATGGPSGDAGSGAFANPDGSGGGVGAGLGGFAGSAAAPPGVIGDFQPITRAMLGTASPAASRFPVIPNPLPPTVNKGGSGIVGPGGTTSILFKFTGLKISDNQSPRPQDRVFYSFNYFDNLSASADRRVQSPIQNLQVYHQLFGVEKTIFDGRASVGFRLPLNTISFHNNAGIPGLGGASTAPGDLSLFAKYAIYDDSKGNLVSLGLQVQAPTGPGAFGGSKYYSYYRDTQIQPFVGYIFARDRFYLQGFSAINAPTDSRDVTLLFNDVAIGYYAYRPDDPARFVTAIVPTAEVHVTTPLNHRAFSTTDLASTPDIVNMTFGTNLELRHRAVITAAYVTPVTGSKPFNAEFVLLFNLRFGGSARGRLPGFPTQ